MVVGESGGMPGRGGLQPRLSVNYPIATMTKKLDPGEYLSKALPHLATAESRDRTQVAKYGTLNLYRAR